MSLKHTKTNVVNCRNKYNILKNKEKSGGKNMNNLILIFKEFFKINAILTNNFLQKLEKMICS